MKHIRKMVAPLIIGIVCVLVLLIYLWMLQIPGMPSAVKAVGLVIILGLIGTMIYVTVERIREIRSGEEDDLSKY